MRSAALCVATVLASPARAAEATLLAPSEVPVSSADDTEQRPESATRIDPAPYAGRGAVLSEVLEQAPGVSVRRAGGFGAYTALAIRGLGAEHVAVVLDD